MVHACGTTVHQNLTQVHRNRREGTLSDCYWIDSSSPKLLLLSYRIHVIAVDRLPATSSVFTVLHPYYKLDYITLKWGGEKEQQAEIEAGNLDAKNWTEEARKIVDKAVCSLLYYEHAD